MVGRLNEMKYEGTCYLLWRLDTCISGCDVAQTQSKGRREEKTGVESCQRSQLSSPGVSLTLLQRWRPGTVEKLLWLGRALCQPDRAKLTGCGILAKPLKLSEIQGAQRRCRAVGFSYSQAMAVGVPSKLTEISGTNQHIPKLNRLMKMIE